MGVLVGLDDVTADVLVAADDVMVVVATNVEAVPVIG